MADIQVISEDTLLRVKEAILKMEELVARDARNRSEQDQSQWPNTDVYIAKTPIGGIPALVEEEPGSEICEVYKITKGDSQALVPVTGLTRRVFNLLSVPIPGNSIVTISKEKFGFWIVQPSDGTTDWGIATITGGNSSWGYSFTTNIKPTNSIFPNSGNYVFNPAFEVSNASGLSIGTPFLGHADLPWNGNLANLTYFGNSTVNGTIVVANTKGSYFLSFKDGNTNLITNGTVLPTIANASSINLSIAGFPNVTHNVTVNGSNYDISMFATHSASNLTLTANGTGSQTVYFDHPNSLKFAEITIIGASSPGNFYWNLASPSPNSNFPSNITLATEANNLQTIAVGLLPHTVLAWSFNGTVRFYLRDGLTQNESVPSNITCLGNASLAVVFKTWVIRQGMIISIS